MPLQKTPAIIFDIDDTLINSMERRISALNSIAKQSELQEIANIQCLSTLTVENAPKEYSIENALKLCKINENDHKKVKEHWLNIFLSNDGMYRNGKVLGTPLQGALKTVRNAWQRGMHIIYLTGRHHDPEHNDSMRQGTIDELTTHLFPLDNRTTLYMKMNPSPNVTNTKARSLNDAEYKKRVISELKTTYDIRATFDDGPANVGMFQTLLPEAQHYGLTINFHCEKFPPNTRCISTLDEALIT